MRPFLVDSNVVLDIVAEESSWFEWSSQALMQAANETRVLINPIIYAEVSIRFQTIEALEAALPRNLLERESIPFEAAFLAGKCFLEYRKRGRQRNSTPPDFFIGAHAAVAGYGLITRDPRRYRTYFPAVVIRAPN